MPRRKYHGYYRGRRQYRGRRGGYALIGYAVAGVALAFLASLAVIITHPIESILVGLGIVGVLSIVWLMVRSRSQPPRPVDRPDFIPVIEPKDSVPRNIGHSNFTQTADGRWVPLEPHQPQKTDALLHLGTDPGLSQVQHISPVGEAAYQERVKNRQYKKVGGFWVPNTPTKNTKPKSVDDNQTT